MTKCLAFILLRRGRDDLVEKIPTNNIQSVMKGQESKVGATRLRPWLYGQTVHKLAKTVFEKY
jgi:hypothetical protein